MGLLDRWRQARSRRGLATTPTIPTAALPSGGALITGDTPQPDGGTGDLPVLLGRGGAPAAASLS